MTREEKIKYLKNVQRGKPLEETPKQIEHIRKVVFCIRKRDGTKAKAFEYTIKLPSIYH